jgi:hypothetical protein
MKFYSICLITNAISNFPFVGKGLGLSMQLIRCWLATDSSSDIALDVLFWMSLSYENSIEESETI